MMNPSAAVFPLGLWFLFHDPAGIHGDVRAGLNLADEVIVNSLDAEDCENIVRQPFYRYSE